ARNRREATMARTALFVVSLAFFVTGSTAFAVVLCARARPDGTFNTTVKIRTACKPGETQLDPGALGLQGPAGPAGPGLIVKDSNGTAVGSLVVEGGSRYVVMRGTTEATIIPLDSVLGFGGSGGTV